MKPVVYVKLNEITELTHKDVLLKDVAEVYCQDQAVLNKCNAMKVMTVRLDRKKRYVYSIMDVIKKIHEIDPSVEVISAGQEDFIVAYKPPGPPRLGWEWAKTVFVCLVCFFGATFAIMTFNNDVDVTGVFGEIYRLVTGQESNGFTVLELGYSIGLAVGILVFFNHFAAARLNTDPTPLEVEMRLYEDNISKTLIAEAGRKESQIDIT